MPARITWTIITIICTGIFAWSVYRDIQLDKHYPGDLRNRVVGARMIKDGRSPYFYKWQEGDGTRYYDPSGFDSLKVSNITATPFFHHLMYPLAEMPERQLSRWWLVIEYLMLLVTVLVALSFTVTRQQKCLVLITTALCLLTEAWTMHIAHGQNYLCIVFLAMLFCYCLSKKHSLFWGIAAGTTAVSLILIKPTALLFFIPFLFIVKKYPRSYILAFLLPIAVITGWIFISSPERNLWIDYKAHIAEQVKAHQQLGPAMQHNAPDPQFNPWEGIDKNELSNLQSQHPVYVYSENGNVFFIVEKLFHIKMTVAALSFLSFIIILLITGLFYYRNRNSGFNWQNVAILGFCLFMIADLFSPVFRHQYYTVQWIFPLLLAAATYTPSQKRLFFLLACGLVLNITNIASFKMEHTIGEYLLLLTFLLLSFTYKPAVTR